MITRHSINRNRRRGFASYILVLSTGAFLSLLLVFTYRRAMAAHTVQSQVQLRTDYREKEDAVPDRVRDANLFNDDDLQTSNLLNSDDSTSPSASARTDYLPSAGESSMDGTDFKRALWMYVFVKDSTLETYED